MLLALTRPVSPSLALCELTHRAREPINLPLAVAQHMAYENVLRSLGVTVVQVAAAPELPDSVFIEDTALALDEVAVISRPGAASRRPETAAVAEVLAQYRKLLHLHPPATLDGGDVLRINRTLYVGRSSRTSGDAITELQRLLEPYDYEVIAVDLSGCLHLKSAATLIAENLILVNPAWLPATAFPRIDRLPIDAAEPYAANALLLETQNKCTLVYPSHFPRTHASLVKQGLHTALVDSSELAKAEGAVTCCSILLNT